MPSALASSGEGEDHLAGTIRLVGDGSPGTGRFEIFNDGSWSAVCDPSFSDTDASVVCRELGYSFGAPLDASLFQKGSGPIWAFDAECEGTESLFSECPKLIWGEHSCTHDDDVGIECTPFSISGTAPMLDLDASAAQCADIHDPESDTTFTGPLPTFEDGVKVWNLDNGFLQWKSGTVWEVANVYTHCAWVKWRAADGNWRTLWRGNRDASIIAADDGTLGMYSDQNGGFKPFSRSIEEEDFEFVCVVGLGNGDPEWEGASWLYTGVGTDLTFCCATDRVVSGSQPYRIGWPNQGPGKLLRFTAWNDWVQPHVLRNFSLATKPLPKLFDLDASTALGPNMLEPVSGVQWRAPVPLFVDGVKAWNLEKGLLGRIPKQRWGVYTVAQDYTHCAWLKWKSGSRTLFVGRPKGRKTGSFSIFVTGDGRLGMYDGAETEKKLRFRPSGASIEVGSFQFVCVVGQGEHATASVGVSKFFVGSQKTSPALVGLSDRVVSGITFSHSARPGHLARFAAFNQALTHRQIEEFWLESAPRVV